MKKRIISTLLAAAMLLAFASCGQTPAETTATTAPTQTTQTTTAETTTAETTTGATEMTTEATTAETTTEETTTEQSTTTTEPVTELVVEFDEENIVLSFGAISDIHIGNFNAADESNFKRALEMLQAQASLDDADGLEAIIGVGDLTDAYTADQSLKSSEITALKAVYESVFNPTDIPFIYTVGNHDHDFLSTSNAGSSLQAFITVMGNTAAHTQYDVECSDSANGSRHAVIGEYHFLFVEPITYNGSDDGGAKYQPATLEWLDGELAKITAENPDHYVFVMTHPMIYDTVYGSDLFYPSTYWYTKDLTTVLEKYSQVVTFGGHLHFPLNDPRSIMQTAFTSLGCGSVNYMAIEPGGYINMGTATTMQDREQFSQGLLCQVDANGNLRIIRMDFYNGSTIGEDWVISHPVENDAHLTTYAKDRGSEENNEAPVFTNVKITLEAGTTAQKASVEFYAADDDFTHDYEIYIINKKSGKAGRTTKILTDFYHHGDPADMKQNTTQSLGSLTIGTTYELVIIATDSWGAVTEYHCDITPDGTAKTGEALPLS